MLKNIFYIKHIIKHIIKHNIKHNIKKYFLYTAKKGKSNKGMATIETLPMLIIFLIILGYSIGFFGVIHTAILHSIATRNYAFETFRHRTNLNYFRDNRFSLSDNSLRYKKAGVRIHGVGSDKQVDDLWRASVRKISFGISGKYPVGTQGTHNITLHKIEPNRRFRNGQGVNPVWITIVHGICTNIKCGD